MIQYTKSKELIMANIVKELLKEGAITQEIADKFETEWTSRSKELNDENKDLREQKETLSKSIEGFQKSQDGLEKQIEGLDGKIKQAKEDGKKELQGELETERSDKEMLLKDLKTAQNDNKALTIDNSVSKALGDFDMLDSDVVSIAIKQNVSLGDDGKIIYKQGDTILSLDDGVKSFFEKKPNLLKSVGEGGSGAEGSGSGSHTVNTKDMTPSQMMKHGREQQK